MTPLVELKHWSVNRGVYGGTRMELVATARAWLPEWYVRRRTLLLAARAVKSAPVPLPKVPLDSVTKKRRGDVTEWTFVYEPELRSTLLLPGGVGAVLDE
ncbi:hypothetical protein [Microbispora sp. GKU 823]|uniref:hypothetical protein n=1 Tax=Microbispora sp. GKU 823 TaxID=1652100 RepID=UPI0009C48AE9|nr:hypothetical protein [Microbispora sp. GKU 823]OPG13648.1 hypothetical protein B1L11_06585 [Microbispora sp. GKU 823]